MAVAVWVATLASVSLAELCFAIGLGLPCGIMARLGRHSLGSAWRLRAGWAGWVPAVGAALLAESAQILLMLARRRPLPAGWQTVELPSGEPDLVARGRSAGAIVVLSATPGSVVADEDVHGRELRLHRLVSAGPDLTELVRR